MNGLAVYLGTTGNLRGTLSQRNAQWLIPPHVETKEATSNIINTRNVSRAYTVSLSANLITASGLILM